MRLSRGWSVFLVLVGVWNWVIWPRFAVAIWNDPRSFSGGAPTGFLLVHVALIVTSLVVGTVTGVYGIRGFVASAKAKR
ncbi:SCO4848 family membrane protein [Fodinicola acaciae]|uniref:SCO4848 family membrane protein n=1 Tax=Fodinicola acaciae TaxID=2681555 RepID=UPI0013D3705C|nr:hypothetical protein [Fodinicola acaciae]